MARSSDSMLISGVANAWQVPGMVPSFAAEADACVVIRRGSPADTATMPIFFMRGAGSRSG